MFCYLHEIFFSLTGESFEECDLLDMMMSAQDEINGGGMTDEELHDQVITIMLAGHEV